MKTKIEQRANVDPEARLLARCYGLILSWRDADATRDEHDAETRERDADTHEDKSDEQKK